MSQRCFCLISPQCGRGLAQAVHYSLQAAGDRSTGDRRQDSYRLAIRAPIPYGEGHSEPSTGRQNIEYIDLRTTGTGITAAKTDARVAKELLKSLLGAFTASSPSRGFQSTTSSRVSCLLSYFGPEDKSRVAAGVQGSTYMARVEVTVNVDRVSRSSRTKGDLR